MELKLSKVHIIPAKKEDTMSNFESRPLPSRDELELAHAHVQDNSDPDERANALDVIGVAYHDRYLETGATADLEMAVSVHEEVMRSLSAPHSRFPKFSNNLGVALNSRFNRSGVPDDIERAILLYQKAIAVTSDADPFKAILMGNLGLCLMSRYTRFGNVDDLDHIITTWKTTVDFTPDGDPDKPKRLQNLANTFERRSERLGNLTDLEEAISLKQTAVNLTPNDHPARPIHLRNLASAFETRFERLGSLEDLERAISLKQTVVDITPSEDPDRPNRLRILGDTFQRRFHRLGVLADLEQAITLKQTAVDQTPNEHPDRPIHLESLGSAFETRFDRLGKLEDVEQAVSLKQIAVDLTPDEHPDRAILLSNLGGAFHTRFRRIGSLADLKQAISLQQNAVDLTPNEHPDKPNRLQNLGNTFEMRFYRLGTVADLEHAISLKQTAVDLTPNERPGKPAQLSDLGNALERRFNRVGRLVDLEHAISLQQTAVDLTPKDHPDRPDHLNNLGRAFETRFNHLGRLADLEQAISLKQMAVDLTPDKHPDKPGKLNDLGNAFDVRFKNVGRLADLEQAISLQQTAVDLTPNNHPERPDLLSNLGSTFETRFDHLGRLVDLEQAISLKQMAVDLTPDEHPGKPGKLSNLGIALQIRFKHVGDLADIEQAISLKQMAVDLTPTEHPDRASLLSNLGRAFKERLIRVRSFADLENTNSAFSASAMSQTGNPMVKFDAARMWASLSSGLRRSPLPAFDCAINLLPRIAWLGLPVADQHVHLARVGKVVRDAVSAAITMQEYQIAVEWAEQGRSIVWQNLLGLRSPLEDLRKVHPELADRLQYISQKLEGSGSSGDSMGEVEAEPLKRVAERASQLAAEWDQIVEEVRKIPSFEYFLKAKGFEKLAPAAHDGPVVILNVHDDQCDALVLKLDNSLPQKVSVVHFQLATFSYDMAEELSQTLNTLLALSGRSREVRKSEREGYSAPEKNAKFEEILSTLWLHVAKPVVDGLGYQIQPDSPRRIWWCATGPLAFLPIHAAGVYDKTGLGEKLSDYVVSSYTPTLTAILGPPQSVASQDFQLLTVAQPSTPRASPLPGTTEEVRLVKSLSGGLSIESLTNDEATVKRVLQGMERSTWIHLACHGQQDREESMKSGFLLHDGILELSEIVKAQLPKADFAFLSACQTATGDEKLAEESVHLAAGMLFSGFRGVVATMWSIGDGDAPQVAVDVYRKILENGKPDRRKAAHALHQAVQQLQKNGAGFLSWVPFIHIGR